MVNTRLRVYHSQLRKLYDNPGAVDWSKVLEVPRIPAINGKNTIRVRFGFVSGHKHIKFVVQFIDNEDMASISNVLYAFAVDSIQGRRCYSQVVVRKTVADIFDDNKYAYFDTTFENSFIQFDTKRQITEVYLSPWMRFSLFVKNYFMKAGNQKLTIASNDTPKNSLKSYERGVGCDIDIVIVEKRSNDRSTSSPKNHLFLMRCVRKTGERIKTTRYR